jgi:FKBP-type peptidyl-prolyl cis-trans isomerase 2
MSQTKAIIIIGVLLILVASSAGCTTSDLNPWAKKVKSKIQVTVVGKEFTVQRGENITFAAIVKNKSDVTYNATLSMGKLPKGVTGKMFNNTWQLLRSREKGTLVRIYISDQANLGQFTVTIKGVFNEKKSQTSSAHVKVKVVVPSSGDIRTQDIVDINYIGFEDDGTIFDTSLADIGQNTNIPKAKEWKGHGDTYSPLSVTIDSGGVIQGFNDGIKGLEVGQSRTLFIPPEQGYAQMVNVTINKTDTMKMVQHISWNEFASLYGETPSENKVVIDAYWGWSVQVIDLQGTNVTLMINPQSFMNKTVHPYGFDSKIVGIDSKADGGNGTIQIQNTNVPGVNVTYQDKSGKVVKETDTTIVISYNNNNDPLAHKNLWFAITLTKIELR